ncbi:acyl-CoA dehydrogenase family protein [Novosphingobium colocasiae]
MVPADTPGIEIIRNYSFHGEAEESHGHIGLTNVRVPRSSMLGRRGEAFAVAQARLGGGRLHHAMRVVAEATKLLEMMCERVVSRETKGELLASKQMVQEKIADSWVQLRQFRLLVLETAWLADTGKDWKAIRTNVAAVKAIMPSILHDIAQRALYLHGSLGLSTQMPFSAAIINSYHVGLADGPTEVHKVTIAREVLKGVTPSTTLFPKLFAPNPGRPCGGAIPRSDRLGDIGHVRQTRFQR